MFAVKGFKQVVMMVVERLLELPKKDVVGNLELVYYVFCVGGAYATGGGGGLGPSIDGKRGSEKGLGLKWSECATRGCTGEGAMLQRKGCNKPGGRGGTEFLFRADFVKTSEIEVLCVTKLMEMFCPAMVIL